MVVEWSREKIKIEAPHIQHLLSAIRDLLETFESTYFTKIYGELNVEADVIQILFDDGTEINRGAKI